MKSRGKELEAAAAATVQIKTRKYEAVPIENPGDNAVLMITTARKSSLEARNLCPRCGRTISRDESRICENCGSEACVHCMQGHQEKMLFDDYA